MIIQDKIRWDLFHSHPFFYNKKTSSIAIYRSPTRRHLLCPDILHQQGDISHTLVSTSPIAAYSSAIRRQLPCPYSTACLQSIHIGSIYIRSDPDLKKSSFRLFPRFIPWPSGYVWASSLILVRGFSNFPKFIFPWSIFKIIL